MLGRSLLRPSQFSINHLFIEDKVCFSPGFLTKT